MSEFHRTDYYSSAGDTLKAYVNKVMLRMGIGLAITGLVAFALFMSLVNGGFFYSILSAAYMPVVLVCSIAQLVLCIVLSSRLTSMSTSACTAIFYGYAALTGVTFSVLPLVFDFGTIFQAFLFAAVMFFSCAVIGHTTDVDLTRFSGLIFGALIALVIASLLSLFIPVLRDSLLISYLGIGVFLVLTAFDMQKIRSFYYSSGAYGEMRENLAVYGAFELYLDFINLFLYVLRILGSRNRRN
ncbi:MAG: Bax inhibitor-1/YccA family protein [Solobacterium sp.]|nr:Bax inhibitor-1/YccA family protein [Solobacterium sp.]